MPQLLWALGHRVPVADAWSFVLDVIFCGITNNALRWRTYRWKIDKLVRRNWGDPFRAHDAIGPGANYLTWSCLHHLAERYGALFTPAPELVERKDSRQPWYPPNHFRPLVDWTLTPREEDELRAWTLGPLVQMTALMVHEQRAHLAHLNIIGELHAQLRRGVLALVRDSAPRAATPGRGFTGSSTSAPGRHLPGARRPLARIDEPAWRQPRNAERREIGVVTGPRAYNWDTTPSSTCALDWLLSGHRRVI